MKKLIIALTIILLIGCAAHAPKPNPAIAEGKAEVIRLYEAGRITAEQKTILLNMWDHVAD